MRFLFPAIGVVFDLDIVHNGYTAVTLFMKHTNPKQLANCIIADGDVLRPASEVIRSRYDYCVAVSGPEPAIDYVLKTFEQANIAGLAPKHQRIVRQPTLDGLGLVESGRVDSFGRLVTDEWIRMEHDRCKETGWGYDPQAVNYELSPELQAELAELRQPR